MNLFLETFKEQPFHKQIVLCLFAILAFSVITVVAIVAWYVFAGIALGYVIIWGVIYIAEFESDYKENKRHSRYNS